MKTITTIIFLCFAQITIAQHNITIDGNFDDWSTVPVAMTDSVDNVHNTSVYPSWLKPAKFFTYSDVDLLEVKFTNDNDALYGYMKATGIIGRTSSEAAGHSKKGRYYFIFTIDVDMNDTTGYSLYEGGYYPNSKGYDMNMEVEFYDGAYNTGHYLNHEYINEADYNANWQNDLEQGIVRLAPGSYDYYSQWVMFSDSTYVVVEDKGPVYQGIIEIAVSEDGHEAEMSAPFWGFLKHPDGRNIIDLNQDIIVSASLEASGELSEEAARLGHTPGSTSVWGSNTAEPFIYSIKPLVVSVESENELLPNSIVLHQNYPNPFNPSTNISFTLPNSMYVTLEIFNSIGEKIEEVVSENLSAGTHTYSLNGNNLVSGIYYYRLYSENFAETKSMVLLK